MIAVGLGDAVDLQHDLAGAVHLREAEVHDLVLGLELDRLHLLQALHPALDGRCLGSLGAEATHELLEVLFFALEVSGTVLEENPLFLPLARVPIEVALVLADPFGLEGDDPVDLLVEELAVVADEYQPVRLLLQEAREPADRRHVEVVGGFVEEQQVRSLEEQRGQHRPHLPTAAELAEVPLVVGVLEPEPGENSLGLVVAVEAVVVGEPLVELPHPAAEVDHRLFVIRRIGVHAGFVERLLGPPDVLLQRLATGDALADEPHQRAPPSDGHVLGQVRDARLLAGTNGAAVGLARAGQDSHQGGLAAPVGPDEPHLVLFGEAQGELVEERSPSESDRHVFEDNDAHRERRLARSRPAGPPDSSRARPLPAVALRVRSRTIGLRAASAPMRRGPRQGRRSPAR